MIVISIVTIVLVLVVAGYHFTEGFFTALISAIAAVLAAVLAVSYVEPAARYVVKTAPDCGHSVALVLLFAVAYIAIRQLFDKLIPGNVRTPATLDSVGAALMGLVAGTFSTGILLIAVQMLPFGPTVGLLGYNRFAVNGSRPVEVHAASNAQALDAVVNDQMVDPVLMPDKEGHLWFPADDLVLGTVYRLSNGGSLAGSQALASVHPDWLGELFGERVGQQTGNRRVALALPDREPVSVAGAYTPASLPGHDGYGTATPKTLNSDTEIRPSGYQSPYVKGVKATGNLVPLVVRIHLRSTATDDTDKLFRFSPASIRLVARPQLTDGSFGPGTDYYPIGTLEDSKTVITSRADDFLFVNLSGGESGFDAVFMVDKSVLAGGKNNSITVAPGTFIDVKRLAVIDLSGTAVGQKIPPDPTLQVVRPDTLHTELHPEPTNG